MKVVIQREDVAEVAARGIASIWQAGLPLCLLDAGDEVHFPATELALVETCGSDLLILFKICFNMFLRVSAILHDSVSRFCLNQTLS